MDSRFYNVGSGLTDVTATQVTSDYIITDNINTISGELEMNNNNIVHLNLINGYDLDVFNNKIVFSSNCAINTSNVAFPTSNVAYPTSNLVYSAMQVQSAAVSIIKDTLNATNMIASKLVQCSNLDVTNTLIRVNGSNLLETDKRIDYLKWIKNGPTFTQDNSMAINALAIASAAAVTAGIALAIASRGLFSSAGNVAKDLGDDLGKLFDNDADDPSTNDNNASTKKYVSFKNIKTIPQTLAYDRPRTGSGYLAFRDNVYVSNAKKLCGVSSLNFSYDGNLNSYSFDNSSDPIGKTTIIDFSNKSGYLDSLQSSSDNSFALNSTGLTANCVKVGSFYVTASGIFLGDPANVLTTQQIIDQNGKYLGTIGLSQIVDLESLNFRSIGNGSVVYDNVMTGYTGQPTGMSINSYASFWNAPPQFTGTG